MSKPQIKLGEIKIMWNKMLVVRYIQAPKILFSFFVSVKTKITIFVNLTYCVHCNAVAAAEPLVCPMLVLLSINYDNGNKKCY